MRSILVAADVIGDGGETPYQPWFQPLVDGIAGSYVDDESSFIGKAFDEDQSVLDAITADSRTDFVLPLTIVPTQGIQWASDEDVPGTTFGKIVSWIAAHGLHKLPPGDKNPAQIARHILTQLSGDDYADALESFRTYWSE